MTAYELLNGTTGEIFLRLSMRLEKFLLG